jgi:hypothetical protein
MVATVVAVLAMAVAVEAGHTDIVGDWTVTGGLTRVDGDTINVSGNVTVTGGGVLELHNCTLSIDWDADGEKGVNVTSTGALLAYDCAILGSDGRITVVIRGDSTLERVGISHLWGSSWPEHGMDIVGGDVSISNSSISDGVSFGLVVRTDLVLDNVTIDGSTIAIFAQNRYVAGPFALAITDCHLRSIGAGIGYGVYMDAVQSLPKITLDIEATTIGGFEYGLYLDGAGDSDAHVTGCDILGNTQGALLFALGGTIDLRGNRIGHSHGQEDVGLNISEAGMGKLTLGPNIIEDTGYGLVVDAWSTAGPLNSYGHQTISNCTVGIYASADPGYENDLHLTVHNCTLTNCTTDFVADGQGNQYAATLIVRDTVHRVGSGRVLGARSWIWSYATIDIGTVSWRADGRISQGWLVMEDESGKQTARFDVYALEPRSVIGWELNYTSFVKHVYLWPAMYNSGHRFGGDKVDIWTQGRIDVELVDDVAPAVGIDQGGLAYINLTSLAVTGNYTELGSGVAVLQSALDGSAFADITSFHDGTWTLPLVDLADGPHNLTVRARDAAGNVGNATSWAFVVDTVRPFIEMTAPPGLVNTSTVLLRGATEPGSTITVSGLPYAVAPDGTFAAEVPLVDGDNVLDVLVVDRAGNTNGTRFVVRDDTLLPLLTVDAPRDGTWTNARQVVVEGMTEPGVELRINGERVTETGGAFESTLELSMGTFQVRVTARDSAGNTAVMDLVLHVDWTVPIITIDQPVGGTLVTRDKETYIDGSVDDPSIDHVTIDGQYVILVSGRFVHLCQPSEGVNLYNVTVVDLAGNANSTIVNITCDTIRPTCIVELTVAEGRLVTIGGQLYTNTNASYISVHVVADEPVVLTLAGDSRHPSGKDILFAHGLSEGLNVIGITPVDLAGNDGEVYLARIIKDTTPPTIEIIEPSPDLRTANKDVEIHGRTNANCNVTIGGTRVTLLTDGEFKLTVPLKEGRNDIKVESVDLIGNSNSTVVSVERTGGGPATIARTYLGLALVLGIVVVTVVVVYAAKRGRS